MRILRAITGLPVGTTFAVGDRLTIGRASDSDVQLMDPAVSRHHAKLELDRDGVSVIVDLSSSAGTLVDGVSVGRARLQHGAIITIGQFTLRFEDGMPVRESVRAPRHGGFAALRVTAKFDRVPAPSPAAPAPARGVPAVARPQPESPAQPEPTASPSAAALLRSIHALRSRIDPATAAGATDPLLRPDRQPGRRHHPRYPCTIQGWLARRDGGRISTVPVDLCDVGAGGAKVTWRAQGLDVDAVRWLVLDLDEDDEAPIVVFAATIAWSRPDQRAAGLQFHGPGAAGLDAHELIAADAPPR